MTGVQFYSVDTLTGLIIGQLKPSAWSLGDPLRTAGTGTLTIALPGRTDAVARLRDLTMPRTRWVAARDPQGRYLWCGPIVRTPAMSDGVVTVPVADWRAWFMRAPIRPLQPGEVGTTMRRNYIVTNREQTQIMTDLMVLALNTPGSPRCVIDSAPVTGVNRDLSALMLDRSVGEQLNTIVARGGPEWHCYCTPGSATSLLLHITVDWPERRTREDNPLIQWRVGKGGNTHDPSWPEGQDAPTRVYALGADQPPAQVFAVSEWSEIGDGTEVAWETVLGPLDGVVKTATAFDAADHAAERARGFDGTAEFSIADGKIPLGDLGTGDRVRVRYSNGWVDADTPSSRIVDSTISGGRDKPTIRRISVDLADNDYGVDPGEDVTDNGS